MAIPIIALISGAIAAATALSGGGYAVYRHKHTKTKKPDNSGKKDIEKADENISSEEKQIENDVEHTLEKEAGSKKPHGGEKSEEEELVEEAGTKSIENELDKVEKYEDHVEKDTEKTDTKSVHDLKTAEKAEYGGAKPSHLKKKENKTEVKIFKIEGKEEVTEEKEEEEVIAELKDALVLMSTTDELAKEAKVSAIIEDRQEIISEHLSRNLDGIARKLGTLAGYNQITIGTLNWMKNTFWTEVFRDFEAKLKLQLYEERVETSLLARLNAGLDVAKASMNRIDHSENRIEKLTKLEMSEKKKAIKDLNNFIKLKNKELRKVKKKADSRVASDLQKEIQILNSHKSRMEKVNKEINLTEKSISKNQKRAKSMLKILKNWTGAIAVHEHRMDMVHETVINQVKGIVNIVDETKHVIEQFYTENKSFEVIAVDSIKEINKFFGNYEKILDYIKNFHNEMKDTMTACINMAHNERSLFFLLEGIEQAEESIEKGTEAIVALSEAILQADSVVKTDLEAQIKDMEEEVKGMKRLEQITEKLEKAAAYVQAESKKALQAIDYELNELERVKSLAKSEQAAIVSAVQGVASRFVKRMKQVDQKYLSPVKEFENAAVAGRKAADRDYKLAA